MFEILYKICVAMDYTDVDEEEMPMTQFSLIPLICEARKTRAFFNTPSDYHPYNVFGGLKDPYVLHPQAGYVWEAE